MNVRPLSDESFESYDYDNVVNHPKHYTAFGVEVIEITKHLNFCRGNVVKYVARAGLKDESTELEDLKKAAWYLDTEIEMLEDALRARQD